MLGMIRIGQSIQQKGIPPRTATVLRRAGPSPGQAPRTLSPTLRSTDRLHQHLVLPAVAEVVVPPHPHPDLWKHVLKPESMLVQLVDPPIRIRRPVSGATNIEPMKVSAQPPHCRLNTGEDHCGGHR